jgi:hypothetical protein
MLMLTADDLEQAAEGDDYIGVQELYGTEAPLGRGPGRCDCFLPTMPLSWALASTGIM